MIGGVKEVVRRCGVVYEREIVCVYRKTLESSFILGLPL
jgi:hypothetical protein